VLKDLGIDINIAEIAPVEELTLDEPLGLVDRLLRANRESESLDALRTQAASSEPSELNLNDGLLLFAGRLVVPRVDNLSTDLIKEAYNQVSTAYPGRDKTYYLLRPRYY
jgi:hypothetical protein